MKKVIICSKDLSMGGISSALISLLEQYSLDKDLDITLLLLIKTGEYLNSIPSNIKIIELPFKKEFYNIFEVDSNIKFHNRFIRKIYKFINILIYRTTKKFSKTYDYFLKKIDYIKDEYDVAIDFHGNGYFGTAFIAEKINAKQKVMWIHSAELDWTEYIEKYLNKFDKIYCVSDHSRNLFIEKYSDLSKITEVRNNIINHEKILKLSHKFETEFDENSYKILTVARLAKEKGFDIILNSAKILANKNINFKWYIVGEGILKEEIENQIKELNLEKYVFMLGKKENPYPYFANCDIYVQSSRVEGYGITIAEAKFFNKMVICSDIPAFQEQIEDGKNGYLCNLNPDSFADKIIDVYKKTINY